MLDLTCANSKGQSTKRAMCAGVAVAAHYGCSGKSETELRTYYMYDALPTRIQPQVRDSVGFDIALELLHLISRSEALKVGRCLHS